MNIAVAEDSDTCLALIVAALRDLAGTIQSTPTIKGLLELLDEDIFVVWLDLSLADSGPKKTISAIPEIRRRSPKATLMVVSGWGDEYREAALAAGADVYAEKTELNGFSQKAVFDLLCRAAVEGLRRGLPAQIILDRAAAFAHLQASAVA